MKLRLNRIQEPFVLELSNESGNTLLMDANPKIGGLDKGFRPMEVLAGSVAGCATIDVLLILKKQKIEPTHYAVRIEPTRGEGVPAPFEQIHLVFEFDKGVDSTKASRAIRLTLDKYCSVSASLKESIQITFEVELV